MSSFREKMELRSLERLPSACRMREHDDAGKVTKKHNKQQKHTTATHKNTNKHKKHKHTKTQHEENKNNKNMQIYFHCETRLIIKQLQIKYFHCLKAYEPM